MLGATDTTKFPDEAPAGIVMLMEVPLHELMVTGAEFKVTILPFCALPKPVPLIVT
jgi:hypothetical protein